MTPEGTKIPASARAYVKLERATWASDLTVEDQARRNTVLEEQAPMMLKMKNAGEEIATFSLGIFERIASGTKISLASVLQDFESLLFKIVLDMSGAKESLAGAASGWLKGLMGSLTGGGGGLGGAGGSPDTGGGMMAESPGIGAAPTFGGGMAAGGPIMPGRFYEWQEKGGQQREYVTAGSPGQVVNPNNGGRTYNVTLNLQNVQDANTFVKSRGQINAQLKSMLRAADRDV
jgi:hypothetical protein